MNAYTELTVGTRVRYTGDIANQPGNGEITKVNPPSRWTSDNSYNIKLSDGREMLGIMANNFGKGYGSHRFEIVENDTRKGE